MTEEYKIDLCKGMDFILYYGIFLKRENDFELFKLYETLERAQEELNMIINFEPIYRTKKD